MWLAPTDVVLHRARALIVQPDLFFLSNAGMHLVRDRIYGAPELVIEVLSPQPRIGSTEERVKMFVEFGVQECWLVRQDDVSVTVIQCADRRVVSRERYTRRQPIVSAVFPQFTATLDEIMD